MDSNDFKQIKSVEELRSIFRENDNTMSEFFIQLNVGYSWKSISLDGEVDVNGDNKFFIINEVDDSEQVLSADELFDDSLTNIGCAMELGKFYYAWC